MSDFQNFDKFRDYKKDRQSFAAWKKPLQILGVVAIIFGLPIACASLADGESSSGPSRGKAEVTCERAIKNEIGKAKGFTYTNVADLDGGEFTLYGTVQSDTYGQLKFVCSVEGAMSGSGSNATATVEIGR